MATLVLSAAGMAAGGAFGGSVLGVSMAVAGRAAGAMLGRSIDQRLFGRGSEPVEHGRIDRFRLTGASEGASLKALQGRMRVGGQVIWASRFRETSTVEGGGGKGMARPKTPEVTSYSYSVSLALALCSGVITRVGRIWADGVELADHQYTMRVYTGSEEQLPDPKIEAVEGAGQVPAYRGIAYVVFEDLDLTQFGNRVPQFSFEVHRAAQPGDRAWSDMTDTVQGVALIPGTGEYSLATSIESLDLGYAEKKVVNANSASGTSDFVSSVRAMEEELPRCENVSLVVSWFGDDLRCNQCRLSPKVESHEADSKTMPWQVAGIDRAAASAVPREADRPVYGGTPCDASVIQAIRHLSAKGKRVMFYPFILMDQMADNGLTDPWTGADHQPVLPWRGRITTSIAPDRPGTVDQTAAARAQVDEFFNNPEGFRRFILHYAQLCADAGGVDAFCIGSELRSLTMICDDQGYPAVDHLIELTREVRVILGAACKISYAADWSEYHGHQPGGGDKIFHLDPLWADPDIDFIGIDNYMPLSDWRDTDTHADSDWGEIYNLDYLEANVAGGEMYDWYYHSPEAREAQIRTPIEDGLGEAWIWRQKDLAGWWGNHHHNRRQGVRAGEPTAWVPGSKPIWFTEYGCAAIDKGANQPNKFIDPKSSESQLPFYSNGRQDDFMQVQYLRAVNRHFSNEAANPTDPVSGIQMVNLNRAHVWAWDARPWPAFPANRDLWSDGDNYNRGHWLNGRASSRPLAAVVREICAKAGVSSVDTRRLYGMVRGYVYDDMQTARQALQPLMLGYGFDAVEKNGELVFITRDGKTDHLLSADDLAIGEGGTVSPAITRASDAEVSGRVRIGFVEADGAYEARACEAILPDETTRGVSGDELPLALTGGEAQVIAERWLAEARTARDTIKFSLPPSHSDIGAGNIVELAGGRWRIDHVEHAGLRHCEGTAVARELYTGADAPDIRPRHASKKAASSAEALFLDLPLIRGSELEHAPHVAMTARPWSGAVALMSGVRGEAMEFIQSFTAPTSVGVSETSMNACRAGLWDLGPALRVKMVQGSLQSVDPERVLLGANLAAIGDGSPEGWEVFQFSGAKLVAPRTYELTLRLRGQAGTSGSMPDVWPVGSKFILLDQNLPQIFVPQNLRAIERQYRWGPISKPMSDPSWQQKVAAFRGVGLRPYPVCHLRLSQAGADHRVSWIRQTRIDGDGWEGYEVPLGEDRELYQVRVVIGGEIVREQTLDNPDWTYEADARAQDGATGAYIIEVAQLSARFGAGPYRSVSAGTND